ncbi:MAG: hypothetical protein WAU65_01840 [Candidatus Nanoarchaeia archaeon]
MRFNFKKIAAIGASVLLAGMTTAFAAATPFPAPFVQNGAASNVAIVYGTGAGVSPLDVVQAGNIQTNLQSYLTGTSGGVVTTTNGAVEALDQGGSNKIWLNTTLTTAKTAYTSSDFPTLLGTTTFGGNVAATTTQTITLGPGTISTTSSGSADNSGKVEFSKMPTSAYNPSVGLSIGVNNFSNYLYNATIAFSQPINFTASSSQGIPITLFGNQYVVGTMAAGSSSLLLYSSAQTVNLAQGNSTTVSISGVSHTIALNAVSSTQVQLTVDGVAGTLSIGTPQLINGVNVATTSVFPSSGTATGSATILLGANQITMTSGSAVQVGTSNTAIQGTLVYFTGTLSALTGITVQVEAPISTNATLLAGQKFTDPVFGSFQITNAGLSNPLNGTTQRDTITITPSGQVATLGFTDLMGYNASVPFAYNDTNRFSSVNLTYGGATYISPIYPYEMANLSVNGGLSPIVITGTGSSGQLEGHMIQLQSVYNVVHASSSDTNYTSDYIQLYDLVTGQSYNLKGQGITSLSGATNGTTYTTFTLDGKTYTAYFENSSWAEIRYTGDSGVPSSGAYLLYPAISTQNHGQIQLYEPLNLTLSNIDGNLNNVTTLDLPYGGGVTAVTFTPITVSGAAAMNLTNYTVSITGGTGTVDGSAYLWISANNSNAFASANQTVFVTVGSSKASNLTYEFMADPSNSTNRTDVYLIEPGTASTIVNTTAVNLIEGRDVNSNYNTFVTTLAGIASTSGGTLGVSNVYSTSTTNYTTTLYSDSNQNVWVDYWGTQVTKNADSSSSPFATITYPLNQVYEQLYIGSLGSSVTSGSSSTSGALQLGQVLVKDSQVSSVMNDNLIVVGGSCINSAAATLVGGAYCGSAWTQATGVGSGQFLIQTYNNSVLNAPQYVALLVAGYDAPDTQNAATYLTTQKPDMTMGNKYIGTTSTSAQLQVASH